MKQPETPGEKETLETALQVADKEWLTRNQLAEKIQEKSTISKNTAKSHLSTFRKYYEQNGLQTKEEPEDQGSATVYWSKQEVTE